MKRDPLQFLRAHTGKTSAVRLNVTAIVFTLLAVNAAAALHEHRDLSLNLDTLLLCLGGLGVVHYHSKNEQDSARKIEPAKTAVPPP